jgi:murein DD-endopeptidase MepM/ murein hydrolase activator NlpD
MVRVQESERKTPGDASPQPASGEETPRASAREAESPSDARAETVTTDAGTAAEGETPKTTTTSTSRLPEASEKPARGKWRIPPHVRFVLAVAGGTAALIGAAIASLSVGGGVRSAQPAATAATLAATLAAEEPAGESAASDATADAAVEAGPSKPSVWRVAQLADDPSVSLVDVPIDRRPLLSALGSAHVTRAEAARITKSLAEVRDVDHFGPKDALTVALDAATKRVVAFELAESPSEVWQAREVTLPDGSVQLESKKLRLEVERVRVGKAIVVGSDLRASFTDAGLAPIDEVLALLDDALEGHAELADIRPGARLRLIATQERIDGAFVRWSSLDAVEYFPATPNAPSVRVYLFDTDDTDEHGDEASGHGKHRGWYDAKGRQPVRGGWRSPVPLARIASRFNPHRMHPVLHVVMPHNGVDFAAPPGTPVYAAAAGVVASVGPAGPCGNRVEISHAGGVASVYCHLSRFAQGLHAGQHVEQRQLIAYVGQTGRVTGPHLHFGIRRNGIFVDPMTFRLDGVRVVPRALRDDFDRHRVQLDADLDGIPLPAPSVPAIESPSEPETFYEEP